MCALRAHINQTHKLITFSINNTNHFIDSFILFIRFLLLNNYIFGFDMIKILTHYK